MDHEPSNVLLICYSTLHTMHTQIVLQQYQNYQYQIPITPKQSHNLTETRWSQERASGQRHYRLRGSTIRPSEMNTFSNFQLLVGIAGGWERQGRKRRAVASLRLGLRRRFRGV